jgi:hypothetical protein
MEWLVIGVFVIPAVIAAVLLIGITIRDICLGSAE